MGQKVLGNGEETKVGSKVSIHGETAVEEQKPHTKREQERKTHKIKLSD